MNRPASRFARILLVIVAVAFGIRVSYVAFAKQGPCKIRVKGQVGTYPSQCVVGDQIFYNAEANSIAAGRGFVEPLWTVTHPGEKAPPAADHPPVTVIVLAGVNWLVERPPLTGLGLGDRFETHVREDRYAMALFGTILVLLIGLLGRRVGRAVPRVSGDAVGLVAAGIAAISPNLWVNDGLIMAETLTGVAVVGALLLAFALWYRPSLARAAALGVLCGIAALARAELLLFVPLLALMVALTTRAGWADRSAFAVAAVVASLAVIGPWAGFNLARFHDRTLVSTNDGIALAGSNCEDVYYGAGIGLTAITAASACIDNPPPPGDQSEVAAVYRRRAFRYMRTHLRRLPFVVAARVGRTWSVYRPLDMVGFNEGEGREAWTTRLGLVAYYPTLVAAVGGVIIMWRRRARRALWVLLVPAAAATIGAAATYGQTRFRAAAEPSLAILAAVGVVALAVGLGHRLENRRSRPA